ncbi:medium-chain acyl-CoA ligase ACSF2, mitochondrial-like [Porites lutea]|uniref:medium-chain acyl-CoA ligase ACSF2, mitochondrial-like n=1 Tax=Porites lutea TaxID=51062 RepID=UPI003CC67955
MGSLMRNIALTRKAKHISIRLPPLKLPHARKISTRTKVYNSRVQPANEGLKYSYSHGTSTKPLLGDTIGGRFDKVVERFPEREAYVFCEDGHRATFSEFKHEVDQLAAGLISRGLTKGDRLAIWLPNSRDWILTQFAAAQIGLILVCLNPAYQQFEAEYILKKAGCKAVIIADEFKTQNFYSMMANIVPELPEAKPGSLYSTRLPELRDVFIVNKTSEPFRGTTPFKELKNGSVDVDVLQKMKELKRMIQFDDPACLLFTSGTTGHPKGVTLTHHNLVNNAVLVGENMNFQEPGRVCSPWPLFHCAGLSVTSIVCMEWGATAVYPSRGYNSTATLKAVHDERCDTLYGTPSMFLDALANPDLDKFVLSTLRKGLTGASSCSAELMKQVVSTLKIQLTIVYGCTESSPLVSGTSIASSDENELSTVGKVFPHTEIKIVDREGSVVPVNTTGEVCIRGYCVMMGYWGEKEQTEKAVGPTGWLHTGDLGTMDERGYLRIAGRLKDLIIRGGQNVYPAEVEYFLHTHPKIQDAQVISVPDERLGEEVCAWIKLWKGETMTAGELKDYCNGQIAYYKIPRYIKFVDEYPMTASGKVKKYVMKEQAAEEFQSYLT